MELFKMTQKESKELREDVLNEVLRFNREIKLNYAQMK